ncbi:MAG: GNAT family N-acetyltransferase [Planctomycetota bacterium]
MSGFQLRNMRSSDRAEISKLIYHSTNQYYVSIGRSPIFQGDEMSASDIFDVYQQIDPDTGLAAVDDDTGAVIGACFVHPRETHVSLGIMNVHPEHFGRGIARALLSRIIEEAREANKPVRLVSSCFNLDSYSLYTRAGFVPFCTFQDMLLDVPANGLQDPPPKSMAVREATLEDVDAMAAVEREVAGISRVKDYRYFINNENKFWHVSVLPSPNGLDGFLVSCASHSSNMIGPGIARGQEHAAALLFAELNQQRGRCPVLLVPVTCGDLVQKLYAWGARNCEMHVAQSNAPVQVPTGVVMPTFLPETG